MAPVAFIIFTHQILIQFPRISLTNIKNLFQSLGDPRIAVQSTEKGPTSDGTWKKVPGIVSEGTNRKRGFLLDHEPPPRFGGGVYKACPFEVSPFKLSAILNPCV